MGNGLEKKVVLITGGASGIGRGVAEGFINEGSHPVLIDINEKELENTIISFREAGISIDNLGYLSGDLRDTRFHNEIISYTVEKFGSIDILVNCAGIFPDKPALKISESEWDDVFDLNVKYLFFLTQTVANYMINYNIEGNIINISSVASEIARPGIVHYASSKAAVKMLTQVLALEFSRFGILINSLSPGVVETETLLNTMQTEKAKNNHKKKLSNYPFGRAVKISEVVDGTMFLAGNQSTSISGQNLLIDGGYSSGKIY